MQRRIVLLFYQDQPLSLILLDLLLAGLAPAGNEGLNDLMALAMAVCQRLLRLLEVPLEAELVKGRLPEFILRIYDELQDVDLLRFFYDEFHEEPAAQLARLVQNILLLIVDSRKDRNPGYEHLHA